jgi:hypothetical protein
MTGVVLLNPRTKFTDASGTPIAGGSVTVYRAGTTTLAATYQDKALTTFNTNPITLDANGECLLWVDSAYTYKILVKDAQGVTVPGYPVDNLPGGADVGSAAAAAAADLQTYVDLANNAVSSATAQGAIATAAAARAQQAVDAAAIASNGPFENTTDGLANTSSSGATDRYFTVAVENSDTALILYYNDGGVAREITRYASLGETVDTAATLLGDEPDGIAIDATTERTDEAVLIRDTATPANDYDGSLAGFFASTVFPAHRLLVQEDGSLKWQDHQLFLQSKDFTTVSWAKTSTTVTALTAEDDGEIPYEMAATSTTSRIQQNPVVLTGAWYSVEFIVKADTSSRCYVTVNTDASNPRAYFLLSGDGSVTSATAGLLTEISTDDVDGRPLPSGRYRVVVRFQAAGTTLNAALGQCDADASTNVTSGRKLKVYRAHHYRGVKSLGFINTTSAVARGIPYDWTHGYRALLVEEMFTNYRSKWSDDLTQADWTATDITAAYDATGPHGEPCSTITATADNGTILQTTATASTNHTMTAWVRRKTGTGKLYARLNGTDSEITGLSTTAWKKVKFTRTIASAVATFGLKIETSGDEFEVALLKCADQAFATSDLTTHGVALTQRAADVPGIVMTRFPSGAAMTAYFDLVIAEDLPSLNTFGAGFIKATGGDHAILANSQEYLRAQHSISGTLTNFVLGDFTRGTRVEGTLRVDTNNHGGSVNGLGAGYDVRPGEPVVDTLKFGSSQSCQAWLRRMVIIPRALDDGELERWKYSGDNRDARYLDDLIVARHAEAADVLTQREPGLSKFYDRADAAAGFVTWVEKNVNVNSSHGELPARIRGRSWTVNKTTGRLTLGDKLTIAQPIDWDTGLGHMQSPTIIKSTIGADKGMVHVLWTQLDTADGLISPDHRRIYAATSDDNLATAPTNAAVAYDRGAGTYVILSPAGNAVEMPADSDYPGRIVVPFYASASPNIGLLYRDPGGSWTLGATETILGANEPALALRPDGTMLMTIRTETANQHYQVVVSDGGETLGTAALIASGSYTNTALSLSQMDAKGEEGRYGKMLLVGARASSPFVRSGFSVEELVGQPVVPSGTQFRPLGSTRLTGYAASMALSGGFLLAGYEDSAGNSFNDRCSVRLMLLRP